MPKRIFTNTPKILALAFILTACGGGGGSSQTETPTTPPPVQSPDTIPDAFSFNKLSDAELTTNYESNTITVSGINAASKISISGGEYKVNSGDFVNSESEVSLNDKVTLRLLSAASYQTPAETTLTIGNVSATFIVTTKEEPVVEGITASFNLNIKHQVGDKTQFDRRKFITVHASHTENDWYSVGENESPDLITEFVENYDVYFGRDTGGMAWQLGLLPESLSQSGWIDAQSATTNGNNTRWSYSNNNSSRAETTRRHQHRNTNMVVAAQQRPYWPDGTLTKQGWAFSQVDTEQEPFGTATGDYMGQFLVKYFNRGEGDPYGQPKPKYVEVMNEPIWELVEYAQHPTTVEQVFDFHNHVANAIRDTEFEGNKLSQDVLIDGYTAAFPDFDKYNFQQWLDRDKKFIDMAGDNMDFISIHLYDFPIIGGKKQIRSGSNMEATLDLLDAYTQHKLGERLPLVISEYGAQIHDMFNQPWSSKRDWHILKGLNSQLIQFLERPDQIDLVIPFIPVKAEWGRISENVPYYHRLMRQKFEAENETGEQWVYTDLVKFYQLWAKVNGTRIESYSNDQDIQIDGYVDGDKAYLIFNNLEDKATTVALNLFGTSDNTIVSVSEKSLYLDNDQVRLVEVITESLPSSIEIAPDETIIFELTFNTSLNIDQSAQETKYYHHSDLVSIQANQTIQFDLNNIAKTTHGMAMLRLGISRAHGLSLTPDITINGAPVSVPTNYRGYDQYHQGKGRDNFYGVIEIPFTMAQLEENNSIEITFSDSGGHLASKALQVITSTVELKR